MHCLKPVLRTIAIPQTLAGMEPTSLGPCTFDSPRKHFVDEQARLPGLIQQASNELLDVKVVPDLVQYATIRAELEDIDGIPIVSLNEVPLRGWNTMVKRAMDVVVGSAILLAISPFFAVIALLIRWKGGKGPVLLRQERMTLDGKTFEIYKFRTMVDEAEKAYERVLAVEPRAPVAANNLAWLYVASNRNLDQALQLAQTAHQALPQEPSVSDTLGWIFVQKDMADRAVPFLEASAKNAPNDPTFHYHLGTAYLKAGDADKARGSLKKALALKSDFAGADEARKALERLGSS